MGADCEEYPAEGMRSRGAEMRENQGWYGYEA